MLSLFKASTMKLSRHVIGNEINHNTQAWYKGIAPNQRHKFDEAIIAFDKAVKLTHNTQKPE
jgi:hypothetical protein